MNKYPYGAVWLSPSSLSDFEKCPRLYFLRNVYKNPKTGRKIHVANPYMSLGVAVHRTIDSISSLPKDIRFTASLHGVFENIWKDISGEIGGFVNTEHESKFKEKGSAMITRIEKTPGPLKNYALKIKEKIPNMWLSETNLLVLCGVVDWIEVLFDGSLHIIDFKTGKNDEEGRLQLPIYYLLVKSYFKNEISRLSFWYLQKEDLPREAELPDVEETIKDLIKRGNEIRGFRKQKEILCSEGGCSYCFEYEQVLRGKVKYVGVDTFMNRDVYLAGK
jgi:ATP-dependent helicase/DNAse subunit B